MDDFCLTDEVTWIPVETEVPEYPLPVLFWVKERGGFFGWYSGDQWFDVYGVCIDNVSHWTPFPKGPNCELIIGIKIKDGLKE